MIIKRVTSIIVICILFGTFLPITSAKSSPDEEHFYGVIYKQATSLNTKFLHSKGALQDQPKSSVITISMNALTASTLFAEYDTGGSTNLLNIAHRIINASSKYFRLSFHSDRRGWVSSYDFTKETESFVKSRKYTHDQFLMLVGLANSYLKLAENDPKRPDYLEDFNQTYEFIEEYLLDPNGGWIDSLFTFNETLYTKNRFKIVEHICWTIWSVLNLPESFSSPLTLQELIQMVDFLDANGTLNGVIYNVITPDGESTDNVFKLRTNALYGVINLLLYEKTQNSRFLNRGKVVYDFLVNNLWDRGFKLFFDVVDESGLLLVQGKSLIGNALACLLSSRLCRYFPENSTIKSIFVLSNVYMEQYLKQAGVFTYYISCSTDGNPLTNPFTLESNLIRLWQRINTIHVINGSYSSSVSIGEKIQIDLNLANPDNITYEVIVTGEEIEPYNLTTTDSNPTLLVSLRKNAKIGKTEIKIKVQVLNKNIDKTDSLPLVIGSDRKLPQGLVYLVALGILACMVIIARYPPRNLEDLFTRLTSIGIAEEQQTADESTSEEVDTPQGED
ncbi:MAG: hypothetical protein JSW11_17460 [Candidatus Heimdallarchaeota archaeon]|nr:MAG: hypothetical protein JSW11_17460 [Candidatus Heimdallarchaeota archaeon]